MLARLLRRARRHRGLDFVLFAGLILLLLGLIRLLPEPDTREVAGRARVIDGDSVAIAGEEVRLRGIDAPELAQECTLEGEPWACGREAARRLRGAIAGRPVFCKARERDQHDRLLGECRVGDVVLNRWMVEMGWAVSYHDYPAAERAARDARRGLWAGAFQRPRDWRDEHGGG